MEKIRPFTKKYLFYKGILNRSFKLHVLNCNFSNLRLSKFWGRIWKRYLKYSIYLVNISFCVTTRSEMVLEIQKSIKMTNRITQFMITNWSLKICCISRAQNTSSHKTSPFTRGKYPI